MKEIHIGKLIQAKMEAEGRSVTWLAKQLHCYRSNVYKIYQKQTIDMDLLLRISKILKTDFFNYYSDILHTDIK
jgi:plasmid maintenance system antidote protein VapI